MAGQSGSRCRDRRAVRIGSPLPRPPRPTARTSGSHHHDSPDRVSHQRTLNRPRLDQSGATPHPMCRRTRNDQRPQRRHVEGARRRVHRRPTSRFGPAVRLVPSYQRTLSRPQGRPRGRRAPLHRLRAAQGPSHTRASQGEGPSRYMTRALDHRRPAPIRVAPW